MVTGAYVCEQLAQGCYLNAEWQRRLSRKSNALTTLVGTAHRKIGVRGVF